MCKTALSIDPQADLAISSGTASGSLLVSGDAQVVTLKSADTPCVKIRSAASVDLVKMLIVAPLSSTTTSLSMDL